MITKPEQIDLKTLTLPQLSARFERLGSKIEALSEQRAEIKAIIEERMAKAN